MCSQCLENIKQPNEKINQTVCIYVTVPNPKAIWCQSSTSWLAEDTETTIKFNTGIHTINGSVYFRGKSKGQPVCRNKSESAEQGPKWTPAKHQMWVDFLFGTQFFQGYGECLCQVVTEWKVSTVSVSNKRSVFGCCLLLSFRHTGTGTGCNS